jgi:hypothetical protein
LGFFISKTLVFLRALRGSILGISFCLLNSLFGSFLLTILKVLEGYEYGTTLWLDREIATH